MAMGRAWPHIRHNRCDAGLRHEEFRQSSAGPWLLPQRRLWVPRVGVEARQRRPLHRCAPAAPKPACPSAKPHWARTGVVAEYRTSTTNSCRYHGCRGRAPLRRWPRRRTRPRVPAGPLPSAGRGNRACVAMRAHGCWLRRGSSCFCRIGLRTAVPSGGKRARDAPPGVAVRARSHRRALQAIPPSLRREIMRRDGGRCGVPGCRCAVFIDIHHLITVSEGGKHDIDKMILLCGKHHKLVHRGALIIEGSVSRGLRFYHADGTVYGHPAPDPAALERFERAFSALRSLGFKDGEAKRALAEVRPLGGRRGHRRARPWCARRAHRELMQKQSAPKIPRAPRWVWRTARPVLTSRCWMGRSAPSARTVGVWTASRHRSARTKRRWLHRGARGSGVAW